MSDVRVLAAPLGRGATIGILGGGQLGRMLCQAAARLGLKTHVYSPEADAPAFQVSAAATCAAYDDETALARFARDCDAITFEFENVPEATLALLAALKPVAPGARALGLTQDRLAEKRFIAGLGIATAPFDPVDTAEDAARAFARLGGPCVLKTRRLGYDGKGQAKAQTAEEAEAGFAALRRAPAILERFVDFAFEASVIAVRGCDGSFGAYDPPANEHENHILRRSSVPAPLSEAQVESAKRIARGIAEALDYVGVLAVELFVARDHTLIVNEIAPRVHNSGHWTIEACAASQFGNHIRAVAGWPLGSTERHSDAVMENILGDEVTAWLGKLDTPGLHLYGKREARPGRKMGHITRIYPKDGPARRSQFLHED